MIGEDSLKRLWDYLEKLKDKVDETNITAVRTEGDVKVIRSEVTAIKEHNTKTTETLDGKDGVVPRSLSNKNQLRMQWALIIVIIGGLIRIMTMK